MKRLKVTRIHVHFSTEKGSLYNKTPINNTRNKYSVARGEKSRNCSDCYTNTPVIQFLLALSTVFSKGDRQVKYDKPMAWSLSP